MARWLAHGPGPTVALAAVSLVAYATLFASPYELRVFTIAGVYALMVLGYQFIFGHAGALSLAQGAFFGLGAYVTGILGSRYGWSFSATFPLSLAAPAALAAFIAVPVLRLASHYFALATLAVSQLVWLIAVNWQSMTGGANGLAGVPGIEIFDFQVTRGLPLAIFVWSWVILAGIVAWASMRGLYGRCFPLIREAPLAAATLGMDVEGRRAAMLVLSAIYGGVAGALYVHVQNVVSPDTVGFPIMVACLAMAVVGGRGRVSGAIVGALLLVHLPEWMRGLGNTYLIAYGAALLAAVVFVPDGLVGGGERLWRRLWPPACSVPPVGAHQLAHSLAAKCDPSLQITALRKSYGGVTALGGLDMDLAAGEIVAIIGPNGSGKTTLANLITGLDCPDHGRIFLDGQNISGRAPTQIARLGVARSFQTPQLAADQTVLDTVAVARSNREGVSLPKTLLALASTIGPDPSLIRARVNAMALLEQAGLADQALQPCGALAHGDRRRVELMRALATDPKLLILDEPAAGLAESEVERLSRLLRACAERGMGVMVIEHLMGFVLPLADRVICLDEGQVIAEGRPDKVALHEGVRAAYLGMTLESIGP